MYSLDYVDESVIENGRKLFNRVYPEFYANILGVSRDKSALIIECEFPDGTFYFRVDDNTVSHAYKSKEDADKA